MNLEAKDLTVSLSTEGLVSKIDSLKHAGLTISAIVDQTHIYGCDQVHLYPIWSMVYNDFYHHMASRVLATDFSSGELSFRSEQSIVEPILHRPPLSDGLVSQVTYPLAAMASYPFFPERIDSAKALEELQDTNPKAYTVIYPHHEAAKRNGEWWNKRWNEAEPEVFKRLRNKLIRPAPELLDRWGIKTTEEFIGQTNRRGFQGYALDVRHLLRHPAQGFKTEFEHFSSLSRKLLPFTEMIDIHPVVNPEKNTFTELVTAKELLLLRVAKSFNWKGIVVLHYPFGALNASSLSSLPIVEELKNFLG